MKAESVQLFMILITQNYQGIPFAPKRGDASQMFLSCFRQVNHAFQEVNTEWMKMTKSSRCKFQVVHTGLKLASFLMTINYLENADTVLTNTLTFLGRDSNLDTWMPRYQTYVKLMHCRNLACQPDRAQVAYFDAAQMQFQVGLKAFSFISLWLRMIIFLCPLICHGKMKGLYISSLYELRYCASFGDCNRGLHKNPSSGFISFFFYLERLFRPSAIFLSLKILI